MPRRDDLHGLARSVKQHVDGLRLLGVKEMSLGSRASAKTSSRFTALAELDRLVKRCTTCPLYQTATRHVFGEGDPHAKLVFVGEAPGRDEDLQGRPFVGRAGQLLTKMIEAIGLKREDVYICNVIKHRPPQNRLPEPQEVEACKPYLLEQLAILRPTVICTLGAVAGRALLGPTIAIMKSRGRFHEFDGIPLMPTLHPAYLLRNPDAKKLVWQDLKQVKKLLETA